MSATITDEQRAALAALAPALDSATYLAGGVAVALELGHRLSADLDLFVGHDFDPDRLAERLAPIVPGLRIVSRAPGTLYGEVTGVPFSILSYRYPLLAPALAKAGLPVPVASLEDLACMKLAAIAGRGAAKDFWDLHELLHRGVGGGTLASLLELFRKKFPSDDTGHVVRSLAYFGDANAAPLPAGLAPEQWATIQADMSGRVRDL